MNGGTLWEEHGVGVITSNSESRNGDVGRSEKLVES